MKTTAASSSDVRAWARKNGYDVGDRGRLSPTVMAAYEAANGGGTAKTAPRKAAATKAAPRKAATKRPAKTVARPTTAKPEPSPAASEPTTPEPLPVATVDSARVESLEAQLQQLATRVERLEAARAAAAVKPKGLFRRS